MSSFHDSIRNSGGVDGRMACGNEEKSDEKSGFLGSDQEINLVLGREYCLEHEAHFIPKTLLTPLSAIVGSFKYRRPGVPVAEFVIGYLVRIDINCAVGPLMMKEFRVTEVLPDPLGPAITMSSGFLPALTIDGIVNAVSPFCFYNLGFSVHFGEIGGRSLLLTLLGIMSHLLHNLSQHFFTRFLPRSETI